MAAWQDRLQEPQQLWQHRCDASTSARGVKMRQRRAPSNPAWSQVHQEQPMREATATRNPAAI
eukprot:8546695-Alexandrium_andersonii.AAC.1